MNKLAILGMPQDIGSSWRGVDMGPSALRAAGLHRELKALGYTIEDPGNLPCVSMDDAAVMDGADPRLRYKESVMRNAATIRDAVEMSLARGCFPLAIGGDHSQTMGVLAGLKPTCGGRIGVLYVDAHGDFNTPASTPTGNIHGMPLAVACGYGDPSLLELARAPSVCEEAVVLFGVRDLDPAEKENIRQSRIRMITMNDIIEQGFAACLREALDHLRSRVDGIHLSFDVDCMDPSHASGTGYRITGGFSSREALYLMEKVHDSGLLVSAELVEVNPALDRDNQTAHLAVELIARLFGKKTV
jgi:arginase